MPARNETPPATGVSSATGTARCRAAPQLGVDGARGLVVDADHGAVAGPLAGEDVLLGGDIARHVAMAVDMVGRDVEPHRDMGAEGLAAARAGRTTARAHRCRRRRAARDRARRGRYCRRPRSARRPSARIWPISAVVVDLPLVPVMPTNRACRLGAGQQLDVADDLACRRRAPRRPPDAAWEGVRDARADAPAPRRATSRCAAGSASVHARPPPRLARRRRCRPRRRSRSPAAFRARTVARPERASPSTTNDEPLRTARSIIRSPQLQGGEAGHRQDGGDDPEADDDGRLGPALLLEMMVQRRHAEDAPAGAS